MEQVYKRTGILFKILPCLLIILFITMCFYGSSVYATDTPSVTFDDSNFYFTDSYGHQYSLSKSCSELVGHNYIIYYYSSSNEFRLIVDYKDKGLYYDNNYSKVRSSSGEFNHYYVYNISGDSYILKQVQLGTTPTNIQVSLNNFYYSNFDLCDSNNNIVYGNSELERGTSNDPSTNSGGSGNETTGGDIENPSNSDDSGGILSSIAQGFTNVGNFFTQLINFVGSILSYLNPVSENFILNGVLTSIGNILSYINPFSENFFLSGLLSNLSNFFSNLFTNLGNILSYINPFSENFFAYKLLDLLSNLLNSLFVPSQERISAISNTVSSKFDFIDSIKIAVNSMKNIINNVGNAPKLVLSLGATNYTSAGDYTVLDFEFYRPYKTYGDLVLTGFIYAVFLWRLFVTLPNTINGVGGSINVISSIDKSNKGGGS